MNLKLKYGLVLLGISFTALFFSSLWFTPPEWEFGHFLIMFSMVLTFEACVVTYKGWEIEREIRK